MSVRPVAFYTDGSIDVVFDELGHSGTIPASEIAWTLDPMGGASHNFIILTCPDGCGSASSHPVGGGADASSIQQLFVGKVEQAGCACGQVEAGRDDALAKAHIRLACNRMDGPGRWQLDSPALFAEQASRPDQVKVVYQWTDRLIVGMEPDGPVDPTNHGVATLDVAEYDNLTRYDPAWLSQDGQHIQGTPPW